MVVALRVEVNVIAAFILIILILNKRRTGKNLLDERLYQILLVTTLLYAAADTMAWILDGVQAETMRSILYSVNIICYLFCVIVPYIWLLYTEFRLTEDEDRLWKLNIVFIIPVIIYSILVIATPFTGWMFSFDERQMYQRGPLFLLQVILSLLYMLIPSLRALLRLRTTTMRAERKECYNIAVFILFPVMGLVIQVLFYGIPAAIIATVIAELLIYINLQNKQISLDALTGLNNRGQLNRYLGIQAKKEFRTGHMYMLLLDIDRFKLINDTYGHKAGDQALIDMAIVLQNVCGKRGGFLARYGGDEFSIIIDKKTEEEVDHLIEEIEAGVEFFNANGKREYKLSTSIGYAVFGTEATRTIDQLIEAADEQMYQMKIRRHAQADGVQIPVGAVLATAKK